MENQVLHLFHWKDSPAFWHSSFLSACLWEGARTFKLPVVASVVRHTRCSWCTQGCASGEGHTVTSRGRHSFHFSCVNGPFGNWITHRKTCIRHCTPYQYSGHLDSHLPSSFSSDRLGSPDKASFQTNPFFAFSSKNSAEACLKIRQYLSTAFTVGLSPLLLIAWPSENSFKPLVLQKSVVNSFCLAGGNLKLAPC